LQALYQRILATSAVRASVSEFSSRKMFQRIRQAIEATIGRFQRGRAA
jgi:hypothetical protein